MPRVLVVDDNADMVALVRLVLEQTPGWEIRTALTGREAVDAASAEVPDAILLDVMLPDIDGLAVLDRLRAREATRDVPVVFLTARISPEVEERLRASAAAGVIGKPFNVAALRVQVERLLGWDGAPG
jgi:CheY-like chemotaxis protein